MSQPWRKLHRRVTTKWATLSLLARALGTELRRYSDDDDRIELGGLDAPARIARLCGAEPSERRMLPKLIEELSACGYLNVTATDIEIDASVSGDAPSRARRVHENVVTTARELHESSATTAREVHDNCTTTARELRENCTTTAREQHEIRVKQPESLKSGPVEERRGEEKRERGEARARTSPETSRQAIAESYRKRGLAVPGPIAALTPDYETHSKLVGLDAERLPSMLEAFFGDASMASKGFPISWFLANPNQWAKPTTSTPPGGMPTDLDDLERLALTRAEEGRPWAAASKLESAWHRVAVRHPSLIATRKHPGYTQPASRPAA